MNYDEEKTYFIISKPSKEEMDQLEAFELTSPYPHIDGIQRFKRASTTRKEDETSMKEWRKRLALSPVPVIKKTLENTTQLYTHIETERRDDPRRHLQSRFPGLRKNRISETVTTDTFFPSTMTGQGHTCSQLFIGGNTDHWDVYPLKMEHHSIQELQDFTREVGIPNTLKSDNAQSEVSYEWAQHCRQQCIKTETSEPYHPWQNLVEKG